MADIVRDPSFYQRPKPAAEIVNTTLLSRYYFQWSTLSICLFVVSQYVLFFTPARSLFCAHPDYFDEWTLPFNTFMTGALSIVTVTHISRILVSTAVDITSFDHRAALFTSLIVTLIANYSSVLSLTRKWGGVCVDAFGVKTSAEVWSEWLITAPLLTIMMVSVDLKVFYSTSEIWTVLNLYLCIIFGALTQLTTLQPLAAVFLTLSSVFFMGSMITMIQIHFTLDELIRQSAAKKNNIGYHAYLILTVKRKKSLIYCLWFLLPSFPALYFSVILNAITNDEFHVYLMIASCATKVVFCSLCTDAHMEASHPAVTSLIVEQKASLSRASFLRYVFREVRIPLNSLSMGMQIITDSSNLDEDEQEALCTMREATSVMSEALNDIITVQKIEDGDLEIHTRPFSLHELIQESLEPFLDLAADKGAMITPFIEPKVPSTLLGDKYRLKHVLSNVFSNAVKFTKVNSIVDVTVSAGEIYGHKKDKNSIDLVSTIVDMCDLSIVIKDNGPGVAVEAVDKLFAPCIHLPPGELETRNYGFGLSLSRQILEMHGGTIQCSSEQGKGATFTIRITLEVCENPSLEPSAGRDVLYALSDEALKSSSHKKTEQLLSSMDRLERLTKKKKMQEQLVDYENSMTGSSTTGQSKEASKTRDQRRRTKASFRTTMRSFATENEGEENSMATIAARVAASMGLRDSYDSNSSGRDSRHGTASGGSSRTSSVSIRNRHNRMTDEERLSIIGRSISPGANTIAVPELEDSGVGDPDCDRAHARAPGRASTPTAEPIPASAAAAATASADTEQACAAPTPASTPAPTPSPAAAVVPKAPRPAKKTGASYTFNVLVVDDVASNRKLLAMLLKKKGIEPAMAEDGLEALNYIKAHTDSTQIIFMDNTMPNMTGIQAALAIRQAGYKHIMIGITGNSLEEELEDFVMKGADLALTKPLRPQALDILLASFEVHGVVSPPGKRISIGTDSMAWISK